MQGTTPSWSSTRAATRSMGAMETTSSTVSTAGMTIDLSTQTDSHGDTLAGFENVLGTVFDDTITGDDASNTIEGSIGADNLFGLGGDDVILGGFFGFADQDADTADGGLGSDACDAETETNCETNPPRASARRPTAARIAYPLSWKWRVSAGPGVTTFKR